MQCPLARIRCVICIRRGDTLNFTWHKPVLNYIISDSTSPWVFPLLHRASIINFKALIFFSIFTPGCFHYVNNKLVAGLMYFHHPFVFFRLEMGLRKHTCPPLSSTYEKLVLEISSITRRQDNMAMIQKNGRKTHKCLRGTESLVSAGEWGCTFDINEQTNTKIASN